MRPVSLLLSSCSLLVAGAFASSGRSVDPAKSEAMKRGPDVYKALEIMFNDPVLTKASEFGGSRDPLINGHGLAILPGKNFGRKWAPSQIDLIRIRKQIRDSGFQLEEGMFISPHYNGSGAKNSEPKDSNARPLAWLYDQPTGKTLFPKFYETSAGESSEIDAFARIIYKDASKHTKIVSRDNYWIYAAPIKFEHSECLSCHKTAKLNDTACVVALAFRKQ